MNFKDISGLLAQVAPTIATALGGPLAGLATKTIASALTGSESATEDEIAVALSGASPETLAKLKQIDADFAVQMKRLDIDLAAIESGDRASARDREVRSNDSWTPRVLAVLVVGGFFGMLLTVVLKSVPAEMNDAALIMFGGLSASFTAVIAYYFGSSAGSAAKNDLLRGTKK